MKHTLNFFIGILLVSLSGICTVSCNNSSTSNKTADTTTKNNMPKMSPKERLAKNNILERHTNLASMHLLGKVKAFTTTNYKITDKGDKIMEGKTIDSFDEKGNNIANDYTFKTNGKTTEWKGIMKYDANGNDTAAYSYGTDGKLERGSIMAYDNRGNQIASISKERIDSYKYDDKDNLIELDFNMGKNGKFSDRWVYKYDDNGFVKEGATFDTLGKFESKHARHYDDMGNELWLVSYKADGSIDDIDSFKHDANGQLTEFAGYNADGSLKSKETMKYDDKKHRIETLVYKPDGRIDEDKCAYYENEYDPTGNLTKQTTFQMKDGKKIATNVSETAYQYY